MKSTVIVIKIDELGRAVIPIEIRRTLDIKEGDPMEFFIDGDKMILRKYQPGCHACGDVDSKLYAVRKIKMCRNCFKNLENELLALDIKEGDPMEFFIDGDKMILRKYSFRY